MRTLKGGLLLCAATAALAVTMGANAASIADMLGALAGQSGVAGHDRNIDQALTRLAGQINRNMPQKIDAQSRLDQVTAEGDGQLVYHYTLLEKRTSDVPVALFNSRLTPALKTRVCADADLSRLLRKGVTLGYAYRGSDGGDIGKVSFRQRDCASGNG